MPLSDHLKVSLVCPVSKEPVYYQKDSDSEFLFCPQSRLRYRIEDGVPVMLVDEAEPLSEEAVEELVAELSRSSS